MDFSRALRQAGVAFQAVLASIFVACQFPATPQTSTVLHHVSGRITDSTTGVGIAGATFILGKYKATADSTGKYSVTLDPGDTSISGDFAVVAGTGYGFTFLQDGTVDVSTDLTDLNPKLAPTSAPSNVITLSGSVTDDTGTTAQIAGVSLTILNENGGEESPKVVYPSSTPGGYSAILHTFGPKCFIVATVSYDNSTHKIFYYKDADLSGASPIAWNVDVPPATSFSDVGLSGIAPGANIKAFLAVPDYGTVLIWKGLGSSAAHIRVYDPDGYKIAWCQAQSTSTNSRFTLTTPQSLSSNVSLPAFALTAPTAADDVRFATYADQTLDLGTGASTGAKRHMVRISTSAGLSGYLSLTGSSAKLPSEIDSIILTGSGWDIESAAATTEGMSTPGNARIGSLVEAGVGGRIWSQAEMDATTGSNSSGSIAFP